MPGATLRGRYRLDALIGRGGMGQVFAATDLESGGQVAVKVVDRVFADDVLMARLYREAEAAARIRSDYVPSVIEVAETEEREVFLVMERLVGESLSQRIRERGPMSWPEVSAVGEDVLRALFDAHTAGIVHRDLKPSNVFLALKSGRVRAIVLDFGVCKIEGGLSRGGAERLTGTGESIGTVAYMAPEQIRGAARVDDRADLYAFGVLVFEMLTGKLPHDGPSQMAILASKLENPPARLGDHLVPFTVPDGADALVARALSRDPAQRFSSAQELLKAWRALGGVAAIAAPRSAPRVLDDAPTQASDASLPAAPTTPRDAVGAARAAHSPHATQTALTAGVNLRKGSGGRVVLLLVACGLLAGVASVVAFFARGPDAPVAAPRVAHELPVTSPEIDRPISVELPPAPVASGGAASEALDLGSDDEAPVAIELGPDEPVEAGVRRTRARRSRGHRHHARPRPTKPDETRITAQPRY